MSRRDTIIIAVLINAGLLAILFVMAINTDEEKIEKHSQVELTLVNAVPAQQQPNSTTPINNMQAPIVEEIHFPFNDLAMSEIPQPILIEDMPTQAPKSSTDDTINPPPEKTEDVDRVAVTVKRGDTLEKIAKANGTTVSAIKKANNLKSEKLKIGQILQVPLVPKKNSEKTLEPSSTPSKTTDKSDPEYYTVKSGDNPWKIAKQFHVKFDDLLKLNNLDEEKARNMKVGDKIRIR